MNREIKYRAWDKHKNEMRTEGDRWDNEGMYLDINTGQFYTVNHDYYDGIQMSEIEDCILMQFTGLKDKNGKDIYEGDVVEYGQWNPKRYEVGFREGMFCFYTPPGNDYHNMPWYLEWFEVIGNIYENPELLEAK